MVHLDAALTWMKWRRLSLAKILLPWRTVSGDSGDCASVARLHSRKLYNTVSPGRVNHEAGWGVDGEARVCTAMLEV